MSHKQRFFQHKKAFVVSALRSLFFPDQAPSSFRRFKIHFAFSKTEPAKTQIIAITITISKSENPLFVIEPFFIPGFLLQLLDMVYLLNQ